MESHRKAFTTPKKDRAAADKDLDRNAEYGNNVYGPPGSGFAGSDGLSSPGTVNLNAKPSKNNKLRMRGGFPESAPPEGQETSGGWHTHTWNLGNVEFTNTDINVLTGRSHIYVLDPKRGGIGLITAGKGKECPKRLADPGIPGGKYPTDPIQKGERTGTAKEWGFRFRTAQKSKERGLQGWCFYEGSSGEGEPFPQELQLVDNTAPICPEEGGTKPDAGGEAGGTEAGKKPD